MNQLWYLWRGADLIRYATLDTCYSHWFWIILHPPVLQLWPFHFYPACLMPREKSQVTMGAKSPDRRRWVIKIKTQVRLSGVSGTPYLSEASFGGVGCEGWRWNRNPMMTSSWLYPSSATRGRSCSLVRTKGVCTEVTLPATHTMSIVSGLISSASLGFLALYLIFSLLRLPHRAAKRINLRSSLPFERGTNESKGELSLAVSVNVAERSWIWFYIAAAGSAVCTWDLFFPPLIWEKVNPTFNWRQIAALSTTNMTGSLSSDIQACFHIFPWCSMYVWS